MAVNVLTDLLSAKASKPLYSFRTLLSQIQHLESNYRQKHHLILRFLIVIIIFTFSCPPSSSLYSSSFLLFYPPYHVIKVITTFHQLHFLYNFLIHRKIIIVLPYSPIHSFSLMFSLLFFSYHLKHDLHFLVFFTLFSKF